MILTASIMRFGTHYVLPKPLVKIPWFQQSDRQSVKFVDGSWFLPQMDRFGYQEYLRERIPDSVFFNIEEISKNHDHIPHMLPTKEDFERAVSNMGIERTDRLVIYDRLNIFSAARVYWTFKYFGHKNVSVLDGVQIIFQCEGFPLWKGFGMPIETKPPKQPIVTEYKAEVRPELLRNFEQIKENIALWKKGDSHAELVVDVRPKLKFDGLVKEYDPRVSPGHMPFSKNLPYMYLLNPVTGELKTDDELIHLVHQVTNDYKNTKFVLSCYSGVTACMLFLALDKIGAGHKAVYDGSWAEYGMKGNEVEIYRKRNHNSESSEDE